MSARSSPARFGDIRALLPLVLVPVAAATHLLNADRTIVFAASAAAMVPLAGLIGRATETLAARLGGGLGGLLNATFGNAAELIIGVLALNHGLGDLVKASLTGSIISNVLLVFGASAVVGGAGREVQRFNRTAASAGTTMLLLSAVALVVPAVFHWLSRDTADAGLDLKLDTSIGLVLLVTYACYLVFTLKTHRHILGAPEVDAGAAGGPSVSSALITLAAAAAATGYVSELLVDTVAVTAERFGMTQLFVGVVIVALVGNAAEHYSAISFAAADRMDATLGIAVGSSIQIALFVAPVLVLLSYVVAPTPMDLRFTVFEVAAIVLSVVVMAFIAHDGETHWLEGVQLLTVYVILALAFFFLPVPSR